MTSEKKSPREIYRNSAERVGLALELFGAQSQAEQPNLPSSRDLASVSTLLAEVVIAHLSEPESNYRTTILQVGKWLCGATKPEFLEENKDSKPHPYYVVRKGLEVLHMLLHRDLRRKVFSNTESQVYYDFVRITATLPNPSKETVSPGAQTGTD